MACQGCLFVNISNSNLNFLIIMLAEHTADIIKGKGVLEAANAAVGLCNDRKKEER